MDRQRVEQNQCVKAVASGALMIFNKIFSRMFNGEYTRHHLTVPRYQLSTFGSRAFSVAGPTAWNSLPDSLRNPALSSNSFRQSLKTNLFQRYQSAHTAQ